MIYHVTPITPERVLMTLAGRAFMVRWGEHRQAAQCERIGCAVAYDNGAFGFFRKKIEMHSWQAYYDWLEPRLFHPGRWAIIPDVIAAGSQLQDALVAEWPFGHKGAPVWHTDEPIDRLLSLVDRFPRVCIGSTGDQWQIWLPGAWGKVLNPLWRERMDDVWNELGRRRHLPAIHMLRGTALMGMYPFDSADSSSVAQNHHRHGKKPTPLFPDRSGVTDYADKLERRA